MLDGGVSIHQTFVNYFLNSPCSYEPCVTTIRFSVDKIKGLEQYFLDFRLSPLFSVLPLPPLVFPISSLPFFAFS